MVNALGRCFEDLNPSDWWFKSIQHHLKRMEETIVYLNLTNGIEAIGFFPNSRFIRIQSSHCESKAYNTLLMQLSDDFLFNLSQGRRIIIIDGGVNQKYPKAIRQGIEVVLDCLNYAWFDEPILDESYRQIWGSLDQVTKTRLRYYKKLLNTDRLYLLPLGFETTKDGNYAYYADKLKKNLC